ncbi:hypothetical protein FHQ18_00595 [Deferribacter autotrophicus]|uniref:Dynamin N-terminal domain-containing protein n=1 Tax=Deferribacter autotrophicus TaxID=500465 RepID=A0A5A8F6H3_9BACT|nr:dynamin family protein [Deferribacter autotrophicus]KAA0259410.1 hypothetical protein FHQ18_00595 [Deferribacter autotrophicus]
MDKSTEIKETSLYHFLIKSAKILDEKPHIYNCFKDIYNRVEEITEKPLKLAILGEFSCGKSSFINRLIGMDILPTGFMPVTSAVTVLEYSEKEKIEITYKESSGNIITKEYDGYDKLRFFQNQQENKEFINIQKIRVFINNEILKYFHIIDTPGFNDPNNLGELTKSIFDDINYVIWIFKASQAGKETERIYLEEFKSKSLYKDNIYAVVNFGDEVVSDPNEYENVSNEILENLQIQFGDYFVNDEIFLISCVKKDEFWSEKFALLEGDLREKVLEKDKEISRKQLKEEFEKLNKRINEVVQSTLKLNNELNQKFNKFIQSDIGEDLISHLDEIKSNIIYIIREGVNKIENRLKNTSLFKKEYVESLLKFASFYFTAEELDVMRKNIQNIYYEFIARFHEQFKKFKLEVKKIRENNLIKNNKLEEELDRKMDTLSANLNLLQNSKQLLIVGYIIGLLSDDYVYKFIKNCENASENLSDGTIFNLLNMDFDMSYFVNEIKNIGKTINDELLADVGLLEETKEQLKDLEERS